jgi:hypothetical protein
MIILFLSAGFLYYAWKKGLDFFFLAACGCALYHYPIIFFDEIVFFSQGVNIIPVQLGARVSIVMGIFFLLLVGLLVRSPPPFPTVRFSNRAKLYANTLSLAVILLMVLVVLDNGFGLQGREKNEVMGNLGYFYKLYTIFGVLLISLAFVTMKPTLLIFAVAVAFFDLMFGFRGGAAELIAIYFLSRAPSPGMANIRLIIFAMLGIILLILIKETSYFYNDITLVIENYTDLYDSYGLKTLSAANVESAGISAVYNLVILSRSGKLV